MGRNTVMLWALLRKKKRPRTESSLCNKINSDVFYEETALKERKIVSSVLKQTYSIIGGITVMGSFVMMQCLLPCFLLFGAVARGCIHNNA